MNRAFYRYWQPQGFAGLTLLSAAQLTGEFPTIVRTFYNFTTAISGGCQVVQDGKRSQLRSTSPIQTFTNPGIAASTTIDQPSTFFGMHIEPHLMADLLDVPLERLPLFPQFHRQIHHSSTSSHLAARGVALQKLFLHPASILERQGALLDFVQHGVSICAENAPQSPRLGVEHRAIGLVRQRLHDQFDIAPDLNELAALTGLNKFHLLQVFKRATGLSPHQYLTGHRLQSARTLLAAGQPIAQVALETGFVDQAHFSRTFKRYTLITPGQFQRESWSKS